MSEWVLGQKRPSYLVCLDIVGFTSGDNHVARYLSMRTDLEQAVASTPLLSRASNTQMVHIQFLGDELRLAFPCSLANPNEIVDFIDAALSHLKQTGTQVRVIALMGPLTPAAWHDCVVLKGTLTAKAQRWLDHAEVKNQLRPGYIAADEEFSLHVSPRGQRTWRTLPIGLDVVNLFGEHQ